MADSVNAGYWLMEEDSLSAIDIDTNLYIHLFVAFADLHDETGEVIVPHSKLEKILTFPYIIKHKAKSIKTLLSIGGDGAKPESFSNMVGKRTTREAFIKSSIRLAREYQYDGLDLHWLYPSTTLNMQNLALLLSEWREAIEQNGREVDKVPLLLVETVYYSPCPNISLRYPTREMAGCLDWINVVAYDSYTPQSSPKETRVPAALFDFNVYHSGRFKIDEWVGEEGFSNEKIVFVLPFYGWAWNLEDPDLHGIFAQANGPAKGQELGISNEGLVSYKSIKNLITKFSAIEEYNEQVVASFCYYKNVWISYDNEKCVAAKISNAREFGLRGYVVWHMGGDTDDSVLAKTASREWSRKDKHSEVGFARIKTRVAI